MVSEGYINRLRDYITAECAKHIRRAGDKGVNAYGRYTERVLSEWGLSGFAAGQISRWLRGEVKAELDGKTLQRLGLLRGLSTEPEEAGKLAWAWLNGDAVAEPERSELESEPVALKRSRVNEVPGAYASKPGPSKIVDQIASGQYTSEQLKEIAVAAVEKLASIAETQTDDEDFVPRETPLSWLLQNWLTAKGATVEDLAITIGTTVERTRKILQGQPMTTPECIAAAKLARLKPETIAEWGLCPSLKASSPAQDRT